MGCSTFSNFTVLPEIALAKIRQDAPFDKICYIGCGVTTGIGAVIFTAKVEPGDRVVVFGLGGIGLNVIQGARLAGADQIVGVDINPAREAMARKFGMTALRQPEGDRGRHRAVPRGPHQGRRRLLLRVRRQRHADAPGAGMRHKGWGEVDHHRRGRRGAGDLAPGPSSSSPAGCGRASAFGGARGRTDVPRIVDWYMDGKINIDDLITHAMPLEQHQRGLRPDDAGREHPRRGDLLMAHDLRGALLRRRMGFHAHPSGTLGREARFGAVPAARRRARAGAGAALPRRADLHGGNLPHQGGRPAPGRRAGAGAARARHLAARRGRAGRGRGLGFRHRAPASTSTPPPSPGRGTTACGPT